MHSLPRVKLWISLGLNIDRIIWDNLHQQLKKTYNNGHVLLKLFYAKYCILCLHTKTQHKETLVIRITYVCLVTKMHLVHKL